MYKEIERKFLVKGDFRSYVSSSYKITQGYLSSVPERNVRIRIYGDQAFITVKGISNTSGTTRFEWEKAISMDEARELLLLCEPGTVDKTRHIVPIKDDLFFEVDEFLLENEGLIMAEIELPNEDTIFEKPDWLGEEVTGNYKYYNSYLSKNPFNIW